MLAFFRFSGEQLDESGSFLAQTLLHSKGNKISKFQLIRMNSFGEVKEQTNKHTNSLTSNLLLQRIDFYLSKLNLIVLSFISSAFEKQREYIFWIFVVNSDRSYFQAEILRDNSSWTTDGLSLTWLKVVCSSKAGGNAVFYLMVWFLTSCI